MAARAANRSKIIMVTQLSPATSAMDGMMAISLSSRYHRVLPDARVLSMSFGSPSGSVRMVWVTIWVPPAPPMPITASIRPALNSRSTYRSTRLDAAATACPLGIR